MNRVGAKLRMSAPESRRVRMREPSSRFFAIRIQLQYIAAEQNQQYHQQQKDQDGHAVKRKIPLLLRGFRKCRLKAFRAIRRIAARHRQPASRETVTRRPAKHKTPSLAPVCVREPCDYRRFPVRIAAQDIGRSARFHPMSGCHFPLSCGILVNAMIHAKLTQLALPFFTGRPSPGCRFATRTSHRRTLSSLRRASQLLLRLRPTQRPRRQRRPPHRLHPRTILDQPRRLRDSRLPIPFLPGRA